MNKSGEEPFEALFEQARGDAFTPAEAEQLWQSVASAGPGASAAGPELPKGAARWAGASGTAVKMAAVLLVAGGLVAAAFGAKRARSHGSDARLTAPTGAAQGIEAAPSEIGAPPVVSWEDLPRVSGAPSAPLRMQRARNEALSPPAEAPAPEAEAVASAPTGAVAVETAPAAPKQLPSEGALLLRARQNLASDPSSALALTEQDAQRFPAGPLAPEREVLAVEALARLHRLPEARARLVAFRARYPQSPHLARLDALVGP